MYIRVKRVRHQEYLYLVESVWNPEKKTSKQNIVMYLGNAQNVTEKDIPERYRSEKIVRSIRMIKTRNRADTVPSMRDRMYESLTRGNLADTMTIYEEGRSALGSADAFFDSVLRPVLHRIGHEWSSGHIGIATEHIASNTAQSMIKSVSNQNPKKPNSIKVALCVPPGEKHRMGCDVLESCLVPKGFVVYNLAADMPAGEMIQFVENYKPDVVMISVSNDDNRGAATRLADMILGYGTPVILGGYAFRDGYVQDGYNIVSEPDLRTTLRMIRDVVGRS